MRAPLVETSWTWRRLAVFLSLAVALAILTGLAIATVAWGTDSALARDIAATAGLIVLTVVSAYIGGAVWDDRNKMRHGRIDPPTGDMAAGRMDAGEQ